jgi:integrase
MFRIKKFKESEGRDRVLSNEELFRLLDACQKSSNKLLFLFVLLALTTGARSGELLGLPWDDVDLNEGIIHLKDTKNGRPRILAVVGIGLEMLRDLFKTRNPDKPLVFAGKTRFGKLTLRKPWEKAVREAKIENLKPHDLRHCFATYASESGASNIQLKTATGHLSLSQLTRYCHPDGNIVKQLSNSVYDKISSSIPSSSQDGTSQSYHQNQ